MMFQSTVRLSLVSTRICHHSKILRSFSFHTDTLLGPPELCRVQPTASPSHTASCDNCFMDAMMADFSSASVKPRYNIPPARGLKEKNSPTYTSSGNPCLDFFFHVVPDTPAHSLTERLKQAWDHDPLTALKLICNLRAVCGTGKSDKEGYYTAALWLHGLHPKTLACNVGPLAEAGNYKDLSEILFRLLEGSGAREKHECDKQKSLFDHQEGCEKALKRYSHDPDYRFLFDRISDLFAYCLKSDMQKFNSGEGNKISLAAKWFPSLDSLFDRSTLLCESIAWKMFPVEAYPHYTTVEDVHYSYIVRNRLRKEVLVPLRKVLELPEVYNGSIPDNQVASVAMKFYTEKFAKLDTDRFVDYLENVKCGKTTIGALLPHKIIKSLGLWDGGDVADLLWKRMVDDMAKKGSLRNCMAICDVSKSMSGVPMNVSYALVTLVSELSDDPWKGKVITFSENPTLHKVLGDSLREKMDFVWKMDWGANTGFQKVFDLLLEVAVKNKLTPEQMIKKVFVFSDMEFDDQTSRKGGYNYHPGHFGSPYNNRSSSSWETDYEVIKRKYEEKGYREAIPEIVFWNLRDSKATPVPWNQKGVALVSGYSKNLMTLFLDESKIMDPETVMKAAIAGPEYDKLVVID